MKHCRVQHKGGFMMYETNTELLKQLFSAIERGVWGRAGIYLTDEFQFRAPRRTS